MNNYPLVHGLTDADVKIGMPATICIGGDRYASLVTAVTRKTVTCVHLGNPLIFRRGKTGLWSAKQTYTLRLGEAENYRDPSF